MRRFLAGMLTMLVIIVGGFLLVFGKLRDPGSTIRYDVPLGPGVRPSQPPSDLPSGAAWLSDVTLDVDSVFAQDTLLRDVRAIGQDVVVTDTAVRAGRVTVLATLPFETAARRVGPGVTLFDAGAGRTGVLRTARVLGFDLTIRATGTVSSDRGDLLIVPDTVDIGVPGLVNDAVSNAARQLVTIRQGIPDLPEGLVLTGIVVAPDGFRSTLEGTDVLFEPSPS